MGKILTVINQKGGVGKTTSAETIGAGLQSKGYKVLFIDLDGQGNLSYTMQADNSGLNSNSSYEVISGSITANKAIQRTERGDIIASSPALNGADLTITQTGKEHKLREALEPIKNEYDFIIIDTPPKLGILTVNALTSSYGAIIPAQADIYSLQGIAQLYETIRAVKRYTNPDIKILGIALMRFNERTVISKDVVEMLTDIADDLDTQVFTSRIREGVVVKEAQAMQQDLFSYAPKHNVTKDYEKLIDEIIEA